MSLRYSNIKLTKITKYFIKKDSYKSSLYLKDLILNNINIEKGTVNLNNSKGSRGILTSLNKIYNISDIYFF